jgi:2',3'-cyclic-nucleotide 2'-phosphodiesterase / 3'-nucleotidase
MPVEDAAMSELTRRQTLAAGAALAAGLAGPAGAAPAEGARVALRLLATTDLHVNVVPYDYYRDAADDTVGLAKTASLVRTAMAEAKNTLLVDNGDLIQGSPLGDHVAYETGLKDGAVHPMVAAMNALPYACGTLGNHEFNYGLDFLAAALAKAAFPIVCANVARADGTPFVRPWTVLAREVVDEAGARRTLKVGLIGFVPPQIMQWDKGHLEGRVATTDIVDAARRHLPALLAEKPDLVVALCHSGIGGGERRGGEENAALHLAAVEGIDVLVTGHQHLVFPGPKDFQNIPGVDATKGTLHGKPAVMAGFWGSHLGLVDLDLAEADGRWRVAGFRVEARPIYERVERRVVPKAAADAAVMAAVRAEHEATLAYVRRPVGATAVPINSYFSLVADDASVKVVCDAQSWYLGPLLRDTPHRDLPLLSAAAPFKSGGRGGPSYFTDIKPGPLAIKDLADIYIYPNTVRAVRVTGAQVREWLERSAGIYNRVDPGKGGEQELIDPRFPAFNFDVIAGVRYRIDPTQASRYDGDGRLVAPDARRIRDLTYQDRPVRDDEFFVVATNNYRASGGGNFPGNDGSTIVFEAPDLTRDVIMRYVVERKEVSPRADGSWSLVPPPAGVVATFLTGPGAASHRPAGLAVERLGEGPDGFARYRLVA